MGMGNSANQHHAESLRRHMAALVKAHGSVLSDGLGSIPGHASPERKAVRHDAHTRTGGARPADERQLHEAGVPARGRRVQTDRESDIVTFTARVEKRIVHYTPTDNGDPLATRVAVCLARRYA